MTKEWQDKFPQEVGYWWFYGWLFKREDKPELHLVEVRITGNGVYVYITEGSFIYERQSGGGKWLKATLPELPELEE
jgi:hypothetical protein